MASETALRQSVSAFVYKAIGWAGSSGTCDCALAVSIASGADAYATASPTFSAPHQVGVGRTGDAYSVSFSADGPASATAAAGAAGAGTQPRGSAVTPATFTPTQPLSTADIARGARQLVEELLADAGQSGSGLDPARGLSTNQPDGLVASAPTVSVQVASSGGADLVCEATQACGIAVSISIGGRATASITTPSSCGGSVGTATAIAMAVKADARAVAGRGVASACPVPAAAVRAVGAAVGNTGSVYGIALASAGPAISNAASGRSGAILAKADGSGGAVLPAGTVVDRTIKTATATSGSTGDVAGIAIGDSGATSTARSGNSGHADAVCSSCATASGAVSAAASGDTGSSFSLAGAGLHATANARSGSSGNADATVYGNAAGLRGSGAHVVSESGDTGNAIAEAVDLTTWVSVSTESGSAGAVSSIARGAVATGGSGGTGGSGTTVVNPPTPSRHRITIGRPTINSGAGHHPQGWTYSWTGPATHPAAAQPGTGSTVPNGITSNGSISSSSKPGSGTQPSGSDGGARSSHVPTQSGAGTSPARQLAATDSTEGAVLAARAVSRSSNAGWAALVLVLGSFVILALASARRRRGRP